ncbi:MAG: hypothetical protein R3F59_19245 [Myxococcota bacterium]
MDSVWRAPRGPRPVPVVGTEAAPVLEAGRPLTVLVWNVQFCAGRSRAFFYDGGDAVFVDPADQARTLDRVAEVLRDQQVDVAILQEVDRGSARTGYRDQHAELLARAPFPCHASTPVHDVRYVPFPPQRHLGRVDVHLSVFSRYRMTEGTRWPLPPMDEPWLRRQFNFRRALLELSLPLADGRTLSLFDVHLSAFTGGTGALARQVDAVADRLGQTAKRLRPCCWRATSTPCPRATIPRGSAPPRRSTRASATCCGLCSTATAAPCRSRPTRTSPSAGAPGSPSGRTAPSARSTTSSPPGSTCSTRPCSPA